MNCEPLDLDCMWFVVVWWRYFLVCSLSGEWADYHSRLITNQQEDKETKSSSCWPKSLMCRWSATIPICCMMWKTWSKGQWWSMYPAPLMSLLQCSWTTRQTASSMSTHRQICIEAIDDRWTERWLGRPTLFPMSQNLEWRMRSMSYCWKGTGKEEKPRRTIDVLLWLCGKVRS